MIIPPVDVLEWDSIIITDHLGEIIYIGEFVLYNDILLIRYPIGVKI